MNTLELVTLEEERAVQAFLLREARLLDEDRWDDWLLMVSERIHYWMPGIENRRREDARGGFNAEHMALFDDGYRELQRRVARFKQPSAWAEDPPTRNVHLISNIEVYAGENPGEYRAFSCFVNVRSRGLDEQYQIAGRREDVLCREGDGLKLLSRRILIPNATLPCKNINTFL
ncbi:3-phenylpropionate dioxygenase subunit beta [Azotobacter vinelandii CA]|uniref:Aromatic-Ring-hydroxylating dioxygenase, beta subunit n=2 Tax=Azotobacter vinelandii TaxID=354 RepID=C1DF16_AZOVD|nr:3-phenylpropionate/cinnamic acid dioxygenase subunit beta [Azotobacter vinelandii]ACO80345.1 Aromatic-Ring-hydroxylating dioxygenase, beta subunit [Azotobacter vinelandii DJ]AGK16021.1 3-phenylpropionate dioxygenase subunit beta [Azotobacter vinelandii CA]AGK21871.1 3-phenylpropionate dioxygenase subunit beta [Azotobacter vinelandii CA6]WKN21130.1 3-phenylpropionate/cinnamic acid dioxygenase subunit beta [Azotobacter vinelandii]SFY26448.1 ethylbenzene dioxygenase beta subunit [Azotobacter v